MVIRNQLLIPLIERLKKDFVQLSDAVSMHHDEVASEMAAFVQRKVRQLEMLELMASYMGPIPEPVAMPDMNQTFRQLKLELRVARRRWHRHLVNEARLKRNQEKRIHVSPVAA